MTTKTPDEQAATARDALAAVLEGMAEYGVSDEIATAETMGLAITLALTNPQAIDADDVMRLALALIGARWGGPEGIAEWAEELAVSMRNDPGTPLPTQLN